MSIKLSDVQSAMLREAARREDRCLVAPPTLKGGAAQKVAAKLIEANIVRGIKAKAEAPVWRSDSETGQAYSLKLTAGGLKVASEQEETKALGKTHEPVATASDRHEATSEEPTLASSQAVDAAPRDGSKLATVIALLRRNGGATVVDLTDATGWLAHTTRAALTGLRKRGYAVTRERPEDGPSAYRIVQAGSGASGAQDSAKSSEAGSRKSRFESKAKRAA